MRPCVISGWLLAIVLPVAATAGTTHDAGAVLNASARPAIDAANSDWLPAMRAHDAKRIVKPYGENAVFVLANGGVVQGRAAIEKMYQAGFEKNGRIVSGNLAEDGLTVAGDLIYEWGHARLIVQRGDGKPAISAGKYLTVWQRNGSGEWKIIRNLVFRGPEFPVNNP